MEVDKSLHLGVTMFGRVATFTKTMLTLSAWCGLTLGLLLAAPGCNSILGIGDPSLGSGGEGGANTTSTAPGGAGGEAAGGAGGQGGETGGGGIGGMAPTCEGCTGTPSWSFGWGTSGRTIGTALAIGADGSVVAAGQSNGTVDFGTGPLSASGDGYSIVVVRLTNDQQVSWAKRFSGANDEDVRGVALTAGGDVVIAGTFGGGLELDGLIEASSGGSDRDGYVALLDGSTGAAQWVQTFGGLDQQGIEGVAVTSDGQIAVTGHFESSLVSDLGLTTSQGGADLFVASLTPAGMVSWVEVFASISDEWGRAIAADPDGGLRIAGEYVGSLTLGPFDLANSNQSESFVARLDGTGTPAWAMQFGGNNDQYIRALDVDAAGRVAIGGGLESELVVDGGLPETALFGDQQWVAVVSASGELSFTALYGQLSTQDVDDEVTTPAFDPVDGHLVLGGWFAGSATWGGAMFTSVTAPNDSPSDDVYLAKVASDGTHFWSQIAGDGADQHGRDLAVAPDRSVVQVGAFRGEVTLANAHDCAGTECMFLWGVAP